MTRNEAITILTASDYFWLRPSENEVEALNMAIEALEQEPKRGKWLDYLEEGLKWECSECGSKFTTPWNYCPNCGTKMGVEG